MKFEKIKSHAKINLSLNVLGKKKSKLHNLETLVGFLDLHDDIYIKKTNKKNHGFEDVLISFGSAVMTSGKWIYIDQNGWLVADNKLKP